MFNHYVAVDWAICNMAIARMTEKSNEVKVIDVPSSIKEMQLYVLFEGTLTSIFLRNKKLKAR